MKIKLAIIFLCLYYLCQMKANGQIRYGFELSPYSSVLLNISPDTIVRWGHSGAIATPATSFRIAPAFILRKGFGARFNLETGIGYIANKHSIHLQFDYDNDNFFRPPIDTTFNTSLKYIQVPILITFSSPLQETLKLNLTGGVKTRYLLSFKDNYEDIIYEQRGISDYRYNKIVYAPTFGIALEKELPQGQGLELGFFGNYNANSLVNKEVLWGFFHNLYPVKNQELGIFLKFFL